MFSYMSVYTQIFLLILLIIGNAFLAASEISFAGVRRTRLEAFRDEGYTSAKLVLETADNPGKFFSVIQVGINMVAILGGIIGRSWAVSSARTRSRRFSAGALKSSCRFTMQAGSAFSARS